ncbi:MAG TPA: hypothetical protein VIL55_09635 [Naasia sp.]|jgi:hypothetical protein
MSTAVGYGVARSDEEILSAFRDEGLSEQAARGYLEVLRGDEEVEAYSIEAPEYDLSDAAFE